MNQGDLVVRKSYGGDVLFRVESIEPIEELAILKGTDYRLLADAPIPDLSVVQNPEQTRAAQEVRVKVNESLRRIYEQREQQNVQTDISIRLAQKISLISKCPAKCCIWTETAIT
ncbi:hypothetical protein PACILC2_37010 [Paenibacillus cisolokensis]|uniref:CarD-like/TRCF RNAP-interacting domain-containing protein n=1 Tax=Paenibacillus cisolokensis TaxID=1658519 RepID=A0ABQ4NB05_9BACL|nr:hypothetical protein PACILC2_37010 [Paenibacillus cisolokensis]